MTNLDIRINIRELTDYSATLEDKIDRKTLLLIMKSFSKYVAALYVKMIEEAINSRRYKGKWEPITEEGYIEYLGTSPKVDIFYLIEEAMVVDKIGSNFIVRIDPHYEYPDSDLRLIDVVRAIDNGTSKFNARPLFIRIVSKLRSHITDLWKGYLAMKGIV